MNYVEKNKKNKYKIKYKNKILIIYTNFDYLKLLKFIL